MSYDGSEFGLAVSELTFAAVATRSVLLERTTKFRLVAGRRHRRRRLLRAQLHRTLTS